MQRKTIEGAPELQRYILEQSDHLQIGHAAETLASMTGAHSDLNTLFRGLVLDPETEDSNATALREFNRYVTDHPVVDVVMLPVYDGLTLIRKR
jgi:predicted O-methyltransferase YrrM